MLEKLGREIYEQDIRAAGATDILFQKVKDPQSEGIKGWIVEGTEDNMLFRFVGERDGKFESIYDVRFLGMSKPTLEKPKDRALTERQIALYRARNGENRYITVPASDRYNTVVLPDPEGDRILIYALAATTDSDEVMVGGHYRLCFDKSGEKIVYADQLFKAPMRLRKRDPKSSKDSSVVGLSMSCIVSDKPLETHVYLSLLHALDLYIITTDNGYMWKVSKGKITKMK